MADEDGPGELSHLHCSWVPPLLTPEVLKIWLLLEASATGHLSLLSI